MVLHAFNANTPQAETGGPQSLRPGWSAEQVSEQSSTCGMWAILVAKAEWKPLEFPLSRKMVTQKQYCIPGASTKISATIKDFKNAEVVGLTPSPFNSPTWPVQKTDDHGE